MAGNEGGFGVAGAAGSHNKIALQFYEFKNIS